MAHWLHCLTWFLCQGLVSGCQNALMRLGNECAKQQWALALWDCMHGVVCIVMLTVSGCRGWFGVTAGRGSLAQQVGLCFMPPTLSPSPPSIANLVCMQLANNRRDSVFFDNTLISSKNSPNDTLSICPLQPFWLSVSAPPPPPTC